MKKLIFCFIMAHAVHATVLWADNSPAFPKLEDLTWMDRNHLDKQRKAVDELVRFNFGRQLRGSVTDLELLQRVINEGLVEKTDTLQLQALGAVLGDVYVEDLKLQWRVYEDAEGRSRAVCVPQTQHCLFPITMLSRRMRVGLLPNVKDVYTKGAEQITPYLPKKPFAD